MKTLQKIIFVLTMLLAQVAAAQVQSDVHITDYAIDTLNHKLYIGGSFSSFRGNARTNLAALDSRTGKLLNWDPKMDSANATVGAIAYDDNKIYIAWSTSSNMGRIDVLDSNGGFIRSLVDDSLTGVNYFYNIAIDNGLIYVSGDFKYPNKDFTGTIVFDKSGNTVETPVDFKYRGTIKILFNENKICKPSFSVLYVYNKQDYKLDTALSCGINGDWPIYDYKIDKDTAFVVGLFSPPSFPGSIGGIKYDIKNFKQLDWVLNLDTNNCVGSYIKDIPCSNASYNTGARSIALYRSDVYVGGRLGRLKPDGTCAPTELPFTMNRVGKNTIYRPFKGKTIFNYQNIERRGRKYQTLKDTLYYVTTNEYCDSQNKAVWIDDIASFCLPPIAKLGAFINPILSVCAGTKNVEYTIDDQGKNRNYQWGWTGKSGAVLNPNGNKLTISFPFDATEGTIWVAVVNQCGAISNDSSTIHITLAPTPRAKISAQGNMLTCTNPSLNLSATPNQTQANYLWTFPNGTTQSTQTIQVTQPGKYILSAANQNGLCFTVDSIQIGIDTLRPIIKNISKPDSILTCSRTSISLTGVSDQSPVNYSWIYPDNSIHAGQQIQATKPGTYLLKLTNANNGCFAERSVQIGLDTLRPLIKDITMQDSIITCNNPTLNLKGFSDSNVGYAWTFPDNTTKNEQEIIVTQPGTYLFQIFNPKNGCIAERKVQIGMNTLLPSIKSISADTNVITCKRPSVNIYATSDDKFASYEWTYPNGTIHSGQNILGDLSGTYTLKLFYPRTGCFVKGSVQVGADTARPIIKTDLTQYITSCNPYSVSIKGYSDNSSDIINWYGLKITNTNPVLISDTGYYKLDAIRKSNGCLTIAIVKVKTSFDYPKVIPPSGSVLDTDGSSIIDTITCITPSVLLSFGTNAAHATIFIKHPPFDDTIPNHSAVDQGGYYIVYLRDSITTCKNTLMTQVKYDKTLPQVALPKQVPVLNCSFLSVALNGSSQTPNAKLVWMDGSNFKSPNPATVSNTGKYYLMATDPLNGCTKKDSLSIKKEHTLSFVSQKDTLVCVGSSVMLKAQPIGGNAPFNYLWSENSGASSAISVKPDVTTSYFVNVRDNKNCIGKDTILVKIAPPISDSTLAYASCDPQDLHGEIQIFLLGGIPPFKYSKDSGQTYQSSAIFSNLPYGNYNFLVKDSLSCTHAFSQNVDANSKQPVADFIVNTNMMQKDTFVVVDISNPRPDTVVWNFPPNVQVINNNPFAPIIVTSDTGEMIFTMNAHFRNCVLSYEKKVRCIKPNSPKRKNNGNGIKTLVLYPNPNNGEFTVAVTLFKKQPYGIYVFNAQGIEQTRFIVSEGDYSSTKIILPKNMPGIYILKVITEHDSQSKNIIVTR